MQLIHFNVYFIHHLYVFVTMCRVYYVSTLVART